MAFFQRKVAKSGNNIADRHLSLILGSFIAIIKSYQELVVKNGQFLTEFHQEVHFSTFHLPKSFKVVEIFPKMSNTFLTTELN